MHTAQCLPVYGGMATVLLPTAQQLSDTFVSQYLAVAQWDSLLIGGDVARAIVVSVFDGSAIESAPPNLLRFDYDDAGASVYVWAPVGVTRFILPRRVIATYASANAAAIAWTEQLQPLEKQT